MNAVSVGLWAAVITFGGGVVGLVLQRRLPEKITSGALRDMTGAVGGLLTLLTALVLGLLIGTAYSVFASQAGAVRNLAADVVQLDLALADYGPDAARGRTQLRESIAKTVEQVWGARGRKDYISNSYGEALANLHDRQAILNSLHPATDEQKRAMAAARQAATAIGETRLQMALALTDPVSRPLVFIVIAWATFIFIGFGLLHASNPSALAALAVGAVAVATAIYLVIDLSQPYSGVFRVSPAPIEHVLEQLGKQS